MKNEFIYTIITEDRLGIVGQILSIFYRNRYNIKSVSASKSIITHDLIVCLEVDIEPVQVKPLKLKISRIIEVLSVEALEKSQCNYQKVGVFKVNKSILGTTSGLTIHNLGGKIIDLSGDYILISKSGNDESISEMYQVLNGACLQEFVSTGAIYINFPSDDDIRVSPLAA